MTRPIFIPEDRRISPIPIALFVVATSFIAIQCMGDKPAAKATSAQERGSAPTPPVQPSSAVEVRAEPGSVPVAAPTFETADAAYEAGNFRVAAEMYMTRIDTTPDDAFGHYMLGLSRWKSGDFTGAKEAFDKSIVLDSTFAKAYFNEARVLLDLKRAPEALEVIAKGRAIDSTSQDGWRLTARAKAEGGDVEGAKATYRELLTRDETDAWGLNNLGMLIFDGGEVADAIGPLARAVQLKPTAPVFLNNLGMALEKSGYPVAALHRYELAVEKDSTYLKAVKNVERLKAIDTDSTLVDEVDVDALAEQFRVKVHSWKEEVPKT